MAWQDFLQNNSLALLNTGAGLLSGNNAQEQAANGFKGFAQGMNANKTMQFLQAQHPELAQAVGQGILSPADAYKLSFEYKTKTAQDAADEKRWRDRQQFSWDNDPDRALNEEYKRAQIDALGRRSESAGSFQTLPNGDYGFANPNDGTFSKLGSAPKSPANDVEARKVQAEAAGLAPESPAYQSYLLTGKMPREDQAPLTATDKKAILEADEMILSNQTAIDNLKSVLDEGQGKSLNERAGSGWTTSVQPWLARNDPTGFFDDAKGEATTELNNVVIGNSLGQLKAVFGGNPTEGERAALRELEASANKTPAERKILLNRAIGLAEKRMEFNKQRASELRGGGYYKPTGMQSSPVVSPYKNKYGLE